MIYQFFNVFIELISHNLKLVDSTRFVVLINTFLATEIDFFLIERSFINHKRLGPSHEQ